MPSVGSSLLGPSSVRDLVQRLELRPTKTWGQNFVVDSGTVRKIVRASGVTADDVVLEVGPGLGSLTLALLEHGCSVTAVEIDGKLAGQLPLTVTERAPDAADRLRVVPADALRLDAVPGEPPTALVANLPYNVAVPVVLHLLALLPSLRTGLVMVQKEVADRLAARPGNKTYGIPSVKAAWYADVQSAGDIGRAVFWPVPRVDSGLVRLVRREPPTTTATREQVFRVIDAAFAQRRKTLRAALSSWAGSGARAEEILRAAGVEPGLRGEVLDVTAFAAIAAAAQVLPGETS